ncbi:MAG: hypothetical protein EXR71_15020 [Myxococcales bacterium]|nr:hypothetical protein [Myxococcales bacterium]
MSLADQTVLDERGAPTPIGGELLLFIAHAFTGEADAVARQAARALAGGIRCRIVSVDSAAALGAWMGELGLGVPVGADPHGALARRLGRYDTERFAFAPGWVQIGRDGLMLAMGDGELPAAMAAFFTAPQPIAEPPRRRALPPWLLPVGTALLLCGVLVAYVRSLPPAVLPVGAAPEAVRGDAAAPPARQQGAGRKGLVGGGWYAVPPPLAGGPVRFGDGGLEVEGTPDGDAPMACLDPDRELSGPLRVSGEWSLDAVGGKETKGARVAVRLLDDSGRMVPKGTVAGGSQVFIVNGRRSLDWTPFFEIIPVTPRVAKMRVCVHNEAGSGVVRVRNLVIEAAPE